MASAAPSTAFDVLYVNTPWNKVGLDELGQLPIATSANSTLLLWADSKTLAHAIAVGGAMGFRFHSVAYIMDVAPPLQADEEGKVGRVKTIQQPSWWSSGEDCIARPCAELLLMFTKGEGAPRNGKYKQASFQVLNVEEFSKRKNRVKAKSAHCDPELLFSRPEMFLEKVMGYFAAGCVGCEVYGDRMRASMAAYGPSIPFTFVPALSSEEGAVGAVKKALKSAGKVSLKSVCAKFRKALAAEEGGGAVEGDDFASAVVASLAEADPATFALPLSPSAKRLVLAVADHLLSTYAGRSKKVKRARAGSSENRPRHGIAAPGPVSSELLQFFQEPEGTELARTAVVKRLNQYITEHNLKSGKKIIMDDKLRALLKPDNDQEVSFFNICVLLSPHFLKRPKPEAAAEEGEEGEGEQQPAAKRIKVEEQEAEPMAVVA